jgi:hypothetical protein
MKSRTSALYYYLLNSFSFFSSGFGFGFGSSSGFGFGRQSRSGFLFVLLLSLSFSLNSPAAGNSQNSDEARAQQLFLNTPDIQTSVGQAHLEVQSFSIDSAEDLNRAKREISEKLHSQNRSGDVFVIEARTDEHRTTQLDQSTAEAAEQMAALVEAEHRNNTVSVDLPQPENRSFLKKHYNLTLAFVRFVANAGVVSTGLIVGKGVPVEHALLIGVLAGAMSGAIQLKSDLVFRWLSNSVLLVNTAKRLGLLRSQDGNFAATGERTLREMEMYGRWAMLEAGFLLVARTAMSLLNIPVTENLFLTVGKSTASQGIYEVGIMKSTEMLGRMNSRWASRAAVFKNVALFAGSGVSVLAAIGSMIGMPFANLGFITLTATGLVLNFAPKLLKTKPVEQILQRWRRPQQAQPRLAAGSCHALFAL